MCFRGLMVHFFLLLESTHFHCMNVYFEKGREGSGFCGREVFAVDRAPGLSCPGAQRSRARRGAGAGRRGEAVWGLRADGELLAAREP